MEGATSYNAEEVEKIKQQIVVYRNLLTTLKLGTSLEDYLHIKNEFDELKTQMAQFDSLSNIVNQVPDGQIEEYDEQIKQFSLQLDSLNQVVEEILLALNKLIAEKSTKEQDNKVTFPNTPTTMLPRTDKLISNEKQSSIMSNHHPSYRQLRNLASQINPAKKMEEPIEPIKKNEYTLDPQQQRRHFNHRYFQSITTQPNNIYNGLYKNIAPRTSLRHNGATQRPNHVDDSKKDIIDERVDTIISLPTSPEPETANSSNPMTDEFEKATSNVNEPNPIEEPTVEHQQIELVTPSEEIKSFDVEHKKQKGKSLFDFFRK